LDILSSDKIFVKEWVESKIWWKIKLKLQLSERLRKSKNWRKIKFEFKFCERFSWGKILKKLGWAKNLVKD